VRAEVAFLRPESPAEAVAAFAEADRDGLEPLYYAGGTEILTLAREGRIRPGVLIDLKTVPECRALGRDADEVVLGAALPLNEVIEAQVFPLLGAAASRVADHTVRNRLSLGGNIAGRLPYRETVLALLAADARVELVGPSGLRQEPIRRAFQRRLVLERGEFLSRVRVPCSAVDGRWFHGRRERGTRVDYPLATVCLLETNGALQLAVSGACAYPVGPGDLEEHPERRSDSPADRARGIVEQLRTRIREDFRGSAEYRAFLLEALIREGIERIEGREQAE
jgi:CO/xanthine dehydrogenase FAD-binding subunit